MVVYVCECVCWIKFLLPLSLSSEGAVVGGGESSLSSNTYRTGKR